MTELSTKYPTADDFLDDLDIDQTYRQTAAPEAVRTASENLKERGFIVHQADDAAEGLDLIKSLIPENAALMNGHSTTLEEIGFIDYLETDPPLENLHEGIFAAEDDDTRRRRQREALTAEYFLGSVQAITEEGQMVACGASGSRIGAYPFAAEHVILASGTNKIVSNLDQAMKRMEDYAYPLENARFQHIADSPSTLGKILILNREILPERIHLVLINESLGF